MCKQNEDLDLSLNGETFASLKSDFDQVLERTLGNMTMKGAEEATITIKLGVSLVKTTVVAMGSPRDITKPTFKHDIQSVMQIKDKMSGQLAGNMELVWDEDSQTYILRPIYDGQTSLFDQDEDLEEVAEEDDTGTVSTVAALPEATSFLPPAEEEPEEYEYDEPEE